MCDQICENPPNRLLFQNGIEARKVDAVTNVGNQNKKIFLANMNHHCFLNILVKFCGLIKPFPGHKQLKVLWYPTAYSNF